MNVRRFMALCVLLAPGLAGRAAAVMFLATDDPTYHATTPGDNSGWQYEGKFIYFLGVPIAPNYFITAKHFGGDIGSVFDFHGDLYTTIGYHDVGSTDLRIWEVDNRKPFPTYAPLSSGVVDIGATAAIFGRGTRRGAEVVVAGETKGWQWGPGDDVERWGRNKVVDVALGQHGSEYLYCDFDNPGIAGECHLSTGDSGGGMFVLENGLWRLAGLHSTVDGPFRTDPSGTPFNAALYDVGGLQYESAPGVWTSVPEQAQNIPSSFYSSRISASLALITQIAPEAASLAVEDFNAWQRLYFTPAQIATPATTGPLADFDDDGINNLLEFALNLDPTFSECAVMLPNTGLRGLPLVRVEPIDGADRLTIEFVRRTSGSGAALTYIPEFSANLETWQQVGTATVTAINPRWDRVKIVDALTTGDGLRRFARLRVVLTE